MSTTLKIKIYSFIILILWAIHVSIFFNFFDWKWNATCQFFYKNNTLSTRPVKIGVQQLCGCSLLSCFSIDINVWPWDFTVVAGSTVFYLYFRRNLVLIIMFSAGNTVLAHYFLVLYHNQLNECVIFYF